MTTVDEKTGEIVDENTTDVLVVGTDAIMQSLEVGELPLFMRKLDELDIDPEERESLLSCYTGGTIRTMKDYVGEIVEVQGAAILYHGPFMGKDGLPHDGYYYNVLLLSQEDERGNPIVIRSSSASLMLHLAYALRLRGWFLWEKPVQYKITLGPDGSHRINNIERPKALKRGKK
jgi:hypothetical protein